MQVLQVKSDISKETANNLSRLLQFEPYIPYMTKEEQRQLASGRTDFPLSRIAEWNDALRAHTQYINNIFPHYVKR